MEPRTISELLTNSADKFGARVALQMKREGSYWTLTYKEVLQKSRSLTFFLKNSGIERGDRIALLCKNRPEWAVVYFGILGCGGVVVGIDAKLKPGEIENILTHSEAKLLFTSSEFKSFQFDLRSISVDEKDFMEATSRTEEHTQTPSSPDHLAMLVYTSGTTGSPKAVMLSHNNVISNVLGGCEVLHVRSTDNFLSVLPLNHMFELVAGLLGPLYCGATITYTTGLKTTIIQEAMKETKTTLMLGVPLLFKLMRNGILRRVEESIQPIPFIFSVNRKIARAFRRLHVGKILFRRVCKEFGGRVRFFVSGGAALEPDVASTFLYMGMPILQGYGLTETSPIVSVNTPEAHKIGSVGRPLPGVHVRTLDDGEIIVSGPNVMKGYYKDPEATTSVLKNGELSTGDIGFLDEDGFLYITGRKKNVIVTRAGENVYPEEIEAVFGRSPYIGEICIVGREQSGAENPFAFIIPDYNHFGSLGLEKDDLAVRRVLQRELRNLSADLADYKTVSDFVIFKGEFPRTTTKKVRRHELQQIPNKEQAKVKTEEMTDDFARKLRGLVSRVAEIPEETITMDSDLVRDLGVDSLLKVEILTAIEAKLEICIPDELSYRLQTFRDIVEFTKDYEAGETQPDIPFDEEDEGYDILKERSSLRKFVKSSLSLTLRLFSRLYFSLEVKTAEDIDRLESFIITPNHSSLLDVPIVLSSLPRQTAENMVSPAAKDYFFDRRPIRRWLIRLVFDTFPFDRHGNFVKGLKKCKRTIEEGKSLILFPEGTRSVGGELQPFKVGLAALALDLNIPVVPTYIKGIHEAFGKGMLIPRPKRIEVRFGKPISMDLYRMSSEGLTNYEIYRRIIEDVRKEILRLMQ